MMEIFPEWVAVGNQVRLTPEESWGWPGSTVGTVVKLLPPNRRQKNIYVDVRFDDRPPERRPTRCELRHLEPLAQEA